jgi:hypothetical protein
VPVTTTMEAVAGEIAIALRVLLVTVKALVAERLPEVAVMVEVPAATPVAIPALVIVAVAVLLLDQVTVEVQLALVLLE